MASKKDKFQKKSLYRKVNTKARGVHHDFGKSYDRKENSSKMVKKNRGLDYTPLYKFLLSKVGQNWDGVFSEAISRLDRQEPVWHIVYSKGEAINHGKAGVGESSYYSALYIDNDNILRRVNPELNASSYEPSCPCCTHTFNGVKFTKKYKVKKD